ncbi:hypothetical protein AAMO2058_000886600 [Amorphochlora amoebiformis]
MLADKCKQGDVQTLAMVSLLSKDILHIHEEWITRWVYEYIELLRMRKLHNEATAMIQLSKGPMAEVNQEAKVALTCSKCGHSAQDPRTKEGERGYVCKFCRISMTRCSLCQLPVRGLYVWCQGCGHGGHFKHMMEWFGSPEGEGVCPSGCLHRCHRSQLITLQM